jgi:predicted lipoprotein
VALVVALALAVAIGACTDDDTPTAPRVRTRDTLAAVADDVIVPAYAALVDSIDALEAELAELCAAPAETTLDTARTSWRATATRWRATRAFAVGPAMERRLTAAIGFLARPESIDELLQSAAPVDVVGLGDAGAAVHGISALEVGLFGEGSDALATVAGARRCQYVASTAALATDSITQVLDDWTGGYRDTFVKGMDGDPQSSVDALVNEAIFRVTEVDDQGLRALTEARSADDLSANRADGPAAFHLGELRATFDGVAQVVEGGIRDLVAARSADTARRLDDAMDDAADAFAALPDSVTASFADPDATADAQEAVLALKVLLSTEVASELGVTIGFSDADGDS